MDLLAYDIETGANDDSQAYYEKFWQGEAPSNYKDPEKIKEYLRKARQKAWDGAALKPYTGQVVCISAQIVKMSPDFTTKMTDVEQMFGNFSSSYKTSYGKLRDYAWMLGLSDKHMDGAEVPRLIQEMRAGGGDHWASIVPYCEHDVEIVVEMIIRFWQTETFTPTPLEMVSFYGLEEFTVLSQFFEWVKSSRTGGAQDERLRLIGKNSRTFDRPFLAARAMANNVPLIDEVRHG